MSTPADDQHPVAETGDGLDQVGEPSYEPPALTAATAVLGGLCVTLLVGSSSGLALVVSAAGVCLLLAGMVRGEGPLVTGSVALIFCGMLVAGTAGIRPSLLLIAAVGATIAYDSGLYAIRLGRQLGGDAETTRVELAHVGATATVASTVAGAGAVVFRIASGGEPSTALVVLVIAVIALVWTLLPEQTETEPFGR